MKWEFVFDDHPKSEKLRLKIIIISSLFLLIFDHSPSLGTIKDISNPRSYLYLVVDILFWYPLLLSTILIYSKIIIPRYLVTKKYRKLFLVIMITWILLFLTALGMSYFMQFVLNPAISQGEEKGSLITTVFLANYYTLVINIPLSIFLLAFHFIQGVYREQIKHTRLLKEKVEYQIKSYRGRWHPEYFLHSIKALSSIPIHSSINQSKLILLFSNIISFILYDGNADTVSVEKELDIARDLVELENTLYQRALSLTVHYSERGSPSQIIPLNLINPLISIFVDNPKILKSDSKLKIYINESNNKLLIDSQEYVQDINKLESTPY